LRATGSSPVAGSAKQSSPELPTWIASSLALLAMAIICQLTKNVKHGNMLLR
jgi:hypothetical protein